MLTKRDEKFIKSLQQKRFRKSSGSFVVEGKKSVVELLRSNFKIERILVTSEHSHDFAEVDHEVVSPRTLNSLSSLRTNDACLAVAKMMTFSEADINYQDVIVALDDVSDPGNLGTIVRSLDWYGVDQVVCSLNCADFYNPKTIVSTMGSFSRIKPIYLDLPAFLMNSERPKFVLEMKGKPLHEFSSKEPGIFILGSESHGVSKESRSHADQSLSIVRFGQAESLNVAMAATVLLNHLRFS